MRRAVEARSLSATLEMAAAAAMDLIVRKPKVLEEVLKKVVVVVQVVDQKKVVAVVVIVTAIRIAIAVGEALVELMAERSNERFFDELTTCY